MPEGQGRGVIAADPAPPEGARLWQRPQWRVGDAFTLLRGAQSRLRFTVREAGDGGYLLVGDDGNRMRRDADLGILGEWAAQGDEPTRLLSPADTRFHWPLWVGKKWRCEFVERSAGGPALPLQVSYEVEGVDTVTVAAGTFPALRILRTARLLVEGQRFLDRSTVIWYAPEPGLEVRQLIGESMIELVEWTRADATSPR